MSSNVADEGVVLVPLPAPSLLDASTWAPTPSALALSPEKIVSLYEPGQWEEFILEWATTLQYDQVARNGGANDHGVDVAGFLTAAGFDGPWDCYQCKHYDRGLRPADAFAEILKVTLGVLGGHFTWPRRYRFAAPRGCGTTLGGLIHSPSKLREGLEKELLKEGSPLRRLLGDNRLEEVFDYISVADFSVFGTVELHEIVEQHARTRWHTARFGAPLPARPPTEQPSPVPTAHEQRYTTKLLAAYAERHGGTFRHEDAEAREETRDHYARQRIAFYSAEALQRFARDSVPEGTYEALQGQIFDGVVEVHDAAHSDGLSRLLEVSRTAQSLAITSNGLLPRVDTRDRAGICHQLANDDKLTWCHATSQ